MKKFRNRWEAWVAIPSILLSVLLLLFDLSNILPLRNFSWLYLVFLLSTLVPLFNFLLEQANTLDQQSEEIDKYIHSKPVISIKSSRVEQFSLFTKYWTNKYTNGSDYIPLNTTSAPVGVTTTIYEGGDSDYIEGDGKMVPKFDRKDENTAYFALIDYSNNPKIRNEFSVAKKVISGICFFDLDLNELLGGREITGRWWDEPEKKYLQKSVPPHTLEEADIEPSGRKIRTLAVAMKHKTDSAIYAYNMDSTDAIEWRKDEFLLGSGPVYSRVILAGQNVEDVEHWFRLSVNSKNEMEFVLCQNPNLNN